MSLVINFERGGWVKKVSSFFIMENKGWKCMVHCLIGKNCIVWESVHGECDGGGKLTRDVLRYKVDRGKGAMIVDVHGRSRRKSQISTWATSDLWIDWETKGTFGDPPLGWLKNLQWWKHIWVDDGGMLPDFLPYHRSVYLSKVFSCLQSTDLSP